MRLFQHACPACAAGDSLDCPNDTGGLTRRGLFGAAVGLGFAAMSEEAVAQRLGNAGTRAISIRRAQTGESFSGVYWRDGRYDREALQRLDLVLRDPGMDEATPMDPRLFDVLVTVQRALDSQDTWEVISGYRAPETNAARARQSRRVSRASLHMSGMACDSRLPGRNALGIARIAADMQTGGVGLYRRDGFVHLDCGPARRW
ncbi:DUF882 domain-containing protein [Roseococcus sp. SDR]|uniref:DUF882 domain-containing protein n=1 Tax=Roseococcus sp. SDR TaxID=2835532 RepID=UPI001BCED211|nr:DUF882 domain-containing protein [Roseococcus sp. SDR]MBS7791351.1 DUF882 domain-containing protein [Roseococcus sp. SDR]MBV1846665.1 DUF882 domain-containing protein [Roseococcus sp. SDR]